MASHKLRQLYIEQKAEIKKPFVSIELAIGYESAFDNFPIESEYHHWNSDSLENQLEPLAWYRDRFFIDVDKELTELLKT